MNDRDLDVGFATKQRCHEGQGLLHRAFSVFLFSAAGEVLLQQRSSHKQLWPGFWSNACCSHPRRGEALAGAVDRRLREELGLGGPVRFLFKFHYHEQYGAAGAEHEICHVYAGPLMGPPAVNPNEVAATALVAAGALDHELATRPERYTPWLKLEWTRVRQAWPAVDALIRSAKHDDRV